MNVENLKKMNVLADTLKKHGLAPTREDAANLAGTIVGDKEEQDLSRVIIRPGQNMILQEDEEESKMEEEPRKRGFTEEQLKAILQNFADQFVSEINKLNQKIESQEQMINELTQRMANTHNISEEDLKEELETGSDVVVEQREKPQVEDEEEKPQIYRPVAKEEQRTEKQESQQEPERRETVSCAPARPKTENKSPRSGGYTPDDVSIEKFFYFGQK
jgi:hypothetical protein